jgi:chromosome partitioning protein
VITVIANLKGGSGKSTIAFNLGVWLLMKGEVVIAYDLDPQKTLTDVSLVRKDEGVKPDLKVKGINGSNVSDELRSNFCHVLVDVGAANMEAMKAAISVADRIIIPVPPSQPDIWATQRFLKIIHDVCGERIPDLIAFINRADTHHAIRESDEAEEALKMLEKVDILPGRLCQRTSYRRSLSEGLSVFELSQKSKSSEEFKHFADVLYPNLINYQRGK